MYVNMMYLQGYSTDSQYGWQMKVYKDPLQLDNLTSRKGLTNSTHALGEGSFEVCNPRDFAEPNTSGPSFKV